MIKKGVYAAGLSLFNEDCSLNIEATINHASSIIKKGLHGVFFFGSTGQKLSQSCGVACRVRVGAEKHAGR